MTDASGQIWLTYNGEIYNYRDLRRELGNRGYRFRSETDAEVIIYAYREWGRQCLAHFNGMFAFALWDERRQALFCARDRFGIKPFYYVRTPEGLAFASSIRALALVVRAFGPRRSHSTSRRARLASVSS